MVQAGAEGRDPELMKLLLRLLLRGYQIGISPVLHAVGGAGCGCRFEPSCSQYCLEALEMHGSLAGVWLGMRRLVRCHPWGGSGYDPVPGTLNKK